MYKDNFSSRHIGVTSAEDKKAMLDAIGVGSIDQVMDQVMPKSIRLTQPLDLPAEGMSEYEFSLHMKELAAKNRPLRSFIGMGYYPAAPLAVVMRNIFQNPSWYTSYTPYQAEISQGRLEALLNFQTAVISMTAMPISNCSLLDEATAAAEAMSMMYSQRSRNSVKEGRNVLFVDKNIFPQTLDLLITRSEAQNIELIVDSFEGYEFCGKEFGAILQYPAADGRVCDYSSFAAQCHENEVMVAAACDVMSLAILTPPGEWGADIAVGSTQRWGIPMGFGGPHAAFLATKEEYKRAMPGRIIGVSVDRLGNRALRMALQTREQHIKREKATSNICTSQALMATMAGMYTLYHGREGILNISQYIHSCAMSVAENVQKLGFKLKNASFFDTIQFECPADIMREIAESKGVNFFYPDSDNVRISFDEVTSDSELATIGEILNLAAQNVNCSPQPEEKIGINKNLLRTSPFMDQEIFSSYRSETELMRYIKRLEKRDISLADSMIPLGSCTMKLNAAATMIALDAMGDAHPFAPAEQAEGYLELIKNVERDLSVITGFAGVSLQPNSGAAGEYAGLMVIRAYLQNKGQGYRNIALIPSSAHGTNPASAIMAGMQTVTVACDEKGNIDIVDLENKAEEYKNNLACIMVTYPSTHGVFEANITNIIDIVHSKGGQVYMDGANMNAQVALTNPGFMGADVCHLNLHKTFAMPHGGGGPGVGAIGVAVHLAPLLPSHPIVPTGGENGITAVSAAPYGSALLLPITYGYIKMLGEKGLKASTEGAILAANYMVARLKGEYDVVYTGETGRVGHEMILDLRQFRKEYGVECGDIARRLMDYGFHAPTVSFPVAETLMVEPTESESKAELDRFAEAMIQIKRECEKIKNGEWSAEDNPIKMSPHTAFEVTSDQWEHCYARHTAAYPLEWIKERKFWPYVSKIDAGYGDRNLVCCQ